MPDEWEQWMQDMRQQGYTRQELQEYLRKEGYDPSLVDHYWTTDTTAGHTGLTSDPSLENYLDTLRTVLTSPSGFFRQIDYTSVDAAIFASLNLLIFIALATAASAVVGTVLGQSFLDTLLSSLGTTAWSAINYPVSAVIGALYAYVFLKILGGEGSFEQTLIIHLYASAALLLTWIPVLGLFLSLHGLFIALQGYKQAHGVTGNRAVLVALLPLVLLPVLFLLSAGTFFALI